MQQAGEKDQLSDRVKADTVKALLAVVDSFEMAKGTLKPDSEPEKKIDSAYQVRPSSCSKTECSPALLAIVCRRARLQSLCGTDASSSHLASHAITNCAWCVQLGPK